MNPSSTSLTSVQKGWALHSGNVGDVLFSLPVLKALGIRNLWIKRRNMYSHPRVDTYETLKRLLEAQDYIDRVEDYPSTPFFVYVSGQIPEVDLDGFRKMDGIRERHLVDTYLKTFGIKLEEDWRTAVYIRMPEDDTVAFYPYVHLTDRYRDPDWDWMKYQSVDTADILLPSIGAAGDMHDRIKKTYPASKTVCFRLHDFYDLAQYFAMKKAVLHGNQSGVMALAQMMHIPYVMEKRPGHLDAVTGAPYETVVNPGS